MTDALTQAAELSDKDRLIWWLWGLPLDLYPADRERQHIAYKGKLNDKLEREWLLIKEYHRDVADADTRCMETRKRAALAYVAKQRELRETKEGANANSKSA